MNTETRTVDLPGRLGNGRSHGGDVIFRTGLPEMYDASLRDLVGFAGSL